MQHIVRFIRALYAEYRKDETPRHAAAIAYYTIFSLPALMLVVLSAARAMMMENEPIAEDAFATLALYMNDDTISFLQDTVMNVRPLRENIWISSFSIAFLLLGAIGVIRELRSSLNVILGIKKKPAPYLQKLWEYLMSFILLMLTAVILTASVLSGTFLAAIGPRITELTGISASMINLLHTGISNAAIALLFFLIYLFLPARRFPVFLTLLCSLIASSLLVMGMVIATAVLSQTGFGQAYGVATQALVILFFIAFASHILLLGAEMIEVAIRLDKTASKGPVALVRRILNKKK